VVLAISPLHAEPKSKKSQSTGAVTDAQSPKTPRIFDFEGDDLPVVLRALARNAGLSINIESQVAGVVTMRLENKTPLEALQIVVDSKDLISDSKGGFFIFARRIKER
jgi:type II secretory pathway component GspD/PulD (secretin)